MTKRKARQKPDNDDKHFNSLFHNWKLARPFYIIEMQIIHEFISNLLN